MLEQLRVHVLSMLASFVLWLLSRTWKISRDPALKNGIWGNLDPKIVIFWHNRQLMMPFAHEKLCPPGMPVCTLISRHSDGRIIAAAVRRLGLDSAAGSSSRGASSGLRALCRKIEAGQTVAITPDGPRGPKYELKDGPLQVALLSGATVHPIGISASKAWVFGSWDRMILPKPFATIHFTEAEGVDVCALVQQQGKSKEEVRAELQRHLIEVTERAEGSV